MVVTWAGGWICVYLRYLRFEMGGWVALCPLCELCVSVAIRLSRRRNRRNQGFEVVALAERVEIGIGLQQLSVVEAEFE